jgi:hypothetical protein
MAVTVQSPGAGAVPCTVANLPWGMRTPSPVRQHAFAYKVDRWLSSALGEVASSHRPGESFLIDQQCPLWGGRSALPHVDLPLPASLSSSSVSWGRRYVAALQGKKITRKTVNLLMISTPSSVFSRNVPNSAAATEFVSQSQQPHNATLQLYDVPPEIG